MKTGLYIHLPFCKQKCKYCDFASFAGREFLMGDYVTCLLQEARISPIRQFQTLYVGGGTPSLLPVNLLEKLTKGLTENFGPISQFEESTLEANPESLTQEKLHFLKSTGFNRLSIGLQSFHDQELRTLGRIHSQDDFLQAFNEARNVGLKTSMWI